MHRPFDFEFRLPGASVPEADSGHARPGTQHGPGLGENREVYTVARLNDEVARLLEDSFPLIWVEGELTNVARPRSGHMYFTLKDDRAQVRCALFRTQRARLHFEPRDGMHVIARARIGLYGPRGEFQLVVQELEPAGEGALRLAYDRLRRRLHEEGLFDERDKRPLPAFPRQLGVVTSPTGAAVRDVIKVSGRRLPSLPIVIYPTRVQGDGAGEEIATALERAATRNECDVLLLVRGGGSLEDLWAFNEERVARAIRACPIPIVTGVGHETDITIADFAADERAPTPSAAAERTVPDRSDLLERLAALSHRVRRAMRGSVSTKREMLASHRKRLRHPRLKFENMAQRSDELARRSAVAAERRADEGRRRLVSLAHRLERRAPSVGEGRAGINGMMAQLNSQISKIYNDKLFRFRETGRAFEALSPERTLGRGYAIVYQGEKIVRDAGAVEDGEVVTARLARGRLHATVTSREPD